MAIVEIFDVEVSKGLPYVLGISFYHTQLLVLIEMPVQDKISMRLRAFFLLIGRSSIVPFVKDLQYA